jgi:hypothetical protein
MGPTDVQTALPAIREARPVGDLEGMVSWGLRVRGPGFVRVMTLTGPNRLVVDVQASRGLGSTRRAAAGRPPRRGPLDPTGTLLPVGAPGWR